MKDFFYALEEIKCYTTEETVYKTNTSIDIHVDGYNNTSLVLKSKNKRTFNMNPQNKQAKTYLGTIRLPPSFIHSISRKVLLCIIASDLTLQLTSSIPLKMF